MPLAPSTPARLGVRGVLVQTWPCEHPAPSIPDAAQPIPTLDKIHPMHLDHILRHRDSFAIRLTSNFYAAEAELTLYQMALDNAGLTH